jgi:hypothetical protein
MTMRRILLMVLLAGLGACAVAGMFSIFAGSSTVEGIFAAAITLAVATGMLLPLTLLVDRPNWRAGGIASMIVVGLSAFFVIGIIAEEFDRTGTVPWMLGEGSAMMLGFTVLMGVPVAGGLFLQRFPWAKMSAWLFTVASALAYVLAGFAVLILCLERYSNHHLGDRRWRRRSTCSSPRSPWRCFWSM